VFFATYAPEGVGRPPSERTSKTIRANVQLVALEARAEELSALTEADARLPLEVAEALSILLEVDLAARVALRKDRARVRDRLAIRAPRAAPASPEEEAEEQEEHEQPNERYQRPEPEPAVIVGRKHCQHA
jgi:hypothetical protein